MSVASEPTSNSRNGRNGLGRNGLFLKILIGVNTSLMIAGVLGGVKMNREQGETAMKVDSLGGAQAIESARRLIELEAEAKRTATEQARRTGRLDTLERDAARLREEVVRNREEIQHLRNDIANVLRQRAPMTLTDP